jgi:hypothetical protein
VSYLRSDIGPLQDFSQGLFTLAQLSRGKFRLCALKSRSSVPAPPDRTLKEEAAAIGGIEVSKFPFTSICEIWEAPLF